MMKKEAKDNASNFCYQFNYAHVSTLFHQGRSAGEGGGNKLENLKLNSTVGC
jgi:hypothetical protein